MYPDYTNENENVRRMYLSSCLSLSTPVIFQVLKDCYFQYFMYCRIKKRMDCS